MGISESPSGVGTPKSEPPAVKAPLDGPTKPAELPTRGRSWHSLRALGVACALIPALGLGLVVSSKLKLIVPNLSFARAMALSVCFAGLPALLVFRGIGRATAVHCQQGGLGAGRRFAVVACSIAGAGLFVLASVPAGTGHTEWWPWLVVMAMGAMVGIPFGLLLFVAIAQVSPGDLR